MGGLLSTSKQRLDPEQDLVDLHGKVVMITGGNSGMGYMTAQSLARKGAKVYMAARNESKAVAAIGQLEREGLGDGSVHFLHCNLSDPSAVKTAAECFLQLETRLDILLNIAGKAFEPFQMTTEGLSEHMQTNHIGHFILTDALLDLLKSTSRQERADIRIVNVSSSAYLACKPEKFDREMFSHRFGSGSLETLKSYGMSKLANILHIKELQRRLNAEGCTNITCISLDPGTVLSPIGEHYLSTGMPFLNWLFEPIGRLFAHDVVQGSWTPTFAAAGVKIRDDQAKYQGSFLIWWQKVEVPAEQARSEKLAGELWETTEQVIKELQV